MYVLNDFFSHSDTAPSLSNDSKTVCNQSNAAKHTRQQATRGLVYCTKWY